MSETIQCEPVVGCPLCGLSSHRSILTGLEDHYFGVPGSWDFSGCGGCGLIFLNPRPVPAEIQKCYPSTYARRKSARLEKLFRLPAALENAGRGGYLHLAYGYPARWPLAQAILGSALSLIPGWRDSAAAVVAFLPFVRGGLLLDVGCGSGEVMESMARRGWTAEGVDFDVDAISLCHRRGLRAALGELRDQHYGDDRFDAVIFKHVIEHLTDPVRQLAECRRILRPGGKLVIITPNVESLGRRSAGPLWRGFDLPRHMCLYSLKTLRKAAEDAGLTVERCGSMSRMDWFNRLAAASCAARGVNIYEAAPSFLERLKAALFHVYVSMVNGWKGGVGDELVLVAKK